MILAAAFRLLLVSCVTKITLALVIEENTTYPYDLNSADKLHVVNGVFLALTNSLKSVFSNDVTIDGGLYIGQLAIPSTLGMKVEFQNKDAALYTNGNFVVDGRNSTYKSECEISCGSFINKDKQCLQEVRNQILW